MDTERTTGRVGCSRPVGGGRGGRLGRPGRRSASRLVPANEQVLAWVATLPGPVAVTRRGGSDRVRAGRPRGSRHPRGVRALETGTPAGRSDQDGSARCRRAVPLLHIGEITGIRVPTVVEEDARDLFRARDDARVDLMRARAPVFETVAAPRDRL